MRASLTALDGIAVVITLLQAAALLAFPFVWGHAFQELLGDFCRKDGFPLLTRLSLSVWFPMSFGAVVAAGPALAVIRSVPVPVRRWALVGAFVLGCAGATLCLTGVYLPIFEMSGLSTYAE